MWEIMRSTPQLCFPSKIITETVRKKFTKADVIKRMMKEHKAAFGSLLETKREKNRRLKLEKSGALIPDDLESAPGNSELSWMLKVSGSRLRVVKIGQDNQRYKITASTGKSDSIFTNENDRLGDTQTALIQKTSGSKVGLPENKSSESTFTINRKLKPLLRKKSSLPEVVKVKIVRPPKSSEVAQQNLEENGIENQEEKEKGCVLRLQKNIIDSIRKKSPMEKAPKSMTSTFPEISRSSKHSNENDIQHQEEDKRNSSILLSGHNIIENINKAQLFYEEHEKLDGKQSSEILSLSPRQKEYLQLPSVTHILNATMPDNAKKMLELWTARMIQKLGQDGFDEYKRGLLQNGKLFHSVIDSSLRKIPIEVPDNIKPCYTSVKVVLDEVEHVRAIESQVVHQNLGYRGVVDCVASYRGNLCLIDWKKSDKSKYLLSSTYDAPLQIASYIGALNADKNYPFEIKSGLLVIAYTIGDPSTVFSLDQKKLQYYWKQWLRRLEKYYTMQNT